MMFNILRWFHPMIGVDWHIPVLPPGPLPAPTPYLVCQIMGNPVSLTKLHTTSVFSDSIQNSMVKGTDIGMLTPHIGTFSLIIAIEMICAGSKSHFGPSAINVTDQTGAPGNPAAACLVVANLNLNCGFPVPTPLGVVVTFNTAAVGMTWGDIIGGIFSMALDWVFQTIINLLCFKYLGPVGKAIEGWGGRVAARLGIRALGRAEARAASRAAWRAAQRRGGKETLNAFQKRAQAAAAQRVADFARGVRLGGENVINFLIGSPLGTAVDMPGSPVPSVYKGVRTGAEGLGLPTEADVQQSVDAPSSSSSTPAPNTPAPSPTSTPPSTPPPASPTPVSDAPTCDPEDAVSSYLDDPSVEDIGGN
jgi:hypothetical protein